MDGIVNDNDPSENGRVGGMIAALPLSLMSVYENACPVYMAMGMPYQEFWDGDVSAHRAYREAYRQRIMHENQMLWLQGLYFYEALLDAGQYIKAFSKAKPKPYRDAPIDLFEKERKEREEREQRARYERMKEKMALFAKQNNDRRKKSENKGVE